MSESRLQVSRVLQTCEACPSQWSGECPDGRMVYVRYRGGSGEVRVSAAPTADEMDAVNGEVVASWEGQHWLDGYISESDMMDRTADSVAWPNYPPEPA